MTHVFLRWSLLAVPLLAMTACEPPLAGPDVDGGYARDGRARAFIDAQIGSHPDGTEPGLIGPEASMIHQNYLHGIGRQTGGSASLGAGGLSSAAGQSNAAAGASGSPGGGGTQ